MLVLKVNDTIYPADRCTWQQADAPASSAPGQYTINTAVFIGAPATPVNLGRTTGDTTELGQIGKSGRFVALTGVHTQA